MCVCKAKLCGNWVDDVRVDVIVLFAYVDEAEIVYSFGVSKIPT